MSGSEGGAAEPANSPVTAEDHMAEHPQNNWGSIRYDVRFDVYWTPAGGAKQQLFFCPWCGVRLPQSQRDRWFDALEVEGVDVYSDLIPSAYQTGQWRGVAGKPSHQKTWAEIEGRYFDFFDDNAAADDHV